MILNLAKMIFVITCFAVFLKYFAKFNRNAYKNYMKKQDKYLFKIWQIEEYYRDLRLGIINEEIRVQDLEVRRMTKKQFLYFLCRMHKILEGPDRRIKAIHREYKEIAFERIPIRNDKNLTPPLSNDDFIIVNDNQQVSPSPAIKKPKSRELKKWEDQDLAIEEAVNYRNDLHRYEFRVGVEAYESMLHKELYDHAMKNKTFELLQVSFN